MKPNAFDELVKQHQNTSVDQQFTNVFQNIGQYTSGLSAPNVGMSVAQRNQPMPSQGSSFSQLIQKAINVGKQTVDIGKSAIVGLGKFAVNSAQDIYSAGQGALRTGVELTTQADKTRLMNQTREVYLQKTKEMTNAYAAGKMSKENYSKAIHDLNKGFQDVSQQYTKGLDTRSPMKQAQDIAETAVNILSLGSLSLADLGAKEVVAQTIKSGDKKAIDLMLIDGAKGIEKLVTQFAGARTLIARNIANSVKNEIVGETGFQVLQRNGVKIAADLLIKRPVFYQSNIGQAKSLYEHMMKGEYKGALTDVAWLGMQMLDGGPLGAAKNIAGYSKTAIGKLAHGKGSFIDELSAKIGDGTRNQIAEFVAKSKDPEVEKIYRILQESNLKVTGGKVDNAVQNLLSTYSHADLSTVTPQQIFEDMKNWRNADELWQEAAKAGKLNMTPAEAARYTPVRWDATTRSSVARAVKDAGGDAAHQLEAVHQVADLPGVGFGSNSNLMTTIENIINKAPDAQTAAREIQAIDAAVVTPKSIPKYLQKKINDLGFTIAEPVGGRKNAFVEADNLPKLISGAIKDPTLFDPSAAPQPQLHFLAGIFEKVGASPQEANGFATRQLSESVAQSLHNTLAGSELQFNVKGDKAIGGEIVLSKLQQFIENKPGVKGLDRISAGQSSLTDIRQMTINEIRHALQTVDERGKVSLLSAEAAKEVRQAIVKGYQAVPLDVRGAGDKIVDTLYRVNPAQKYYSRVQGALRYTYNPFFRIQESVETKVLSHVTASNLIWNKKPQELDAAVDILHKARIFTGAFPGEAANDQVLGRITANLTHGQKRDLGGLALDIAKTQGKSLEQLATENPEILDDALRVVVQYPRKGALSSPLARTMNLVFFPMRYNAKVTMIAADALSKQPPAIQKAVLHSMFNMRDYLKSDEGIAWQSKHADAIALFNWVTPVNSISATLNLLGHKPNSMADLGQLGGLPLGLITQILDGQGIINLNRPYVNPSTGEVFPRTIPTTTKARAATALVDLLNTMFTYPGRILGLPGKNQMLKKAVSNVIDTKGTEFTNNIPTENLTPLQQQWVKVVGGDTSKEAVDALYNSPAPGQFNWYTLPPNQLPFNPSFDASSKYKAPKVPKSISNPRRKKIAKPPTGTL